MAHREVAIFILGIVSGFMVSLNYWLEVKSEQSDMLLVSVNSTKYREFHEIIRTSLADDLYDSVKVLCMVMTHPDNHKSKAHHVMTTWGKRCNKLLFVSRSVDPDLPIILLDIPDSRELLWNKTRDAYEYVYKHHLGDADWFMKVDDDS